MSSTPARHAGYTLARPASETRLLDVIEAVEGDVALQTCVLTGGPCRWETELGLLSGPQPPPGRRRRP